MLELFYTWVHSALGICFYELPALFLGLIMVVMGLVHGRNQKKRENDFEDKMAERRDEYEGAVSPEAAL